MPQRVVLLDTSFIVALANRDDTYHERAKNWDAQLLAQDAVLALHWGILFEIADGFARLGRRAKGIALLDRLRHERGYLVHPLDYKLVEEAIELYHEREDKEWSLTDCASFILMAREGIREALTADVHFVQAGFQALLLEKD